MNNKRIIFSTLLFLSSTIQVMAGPMLDYKNSVINPEKITFPENKLQTAQAKMWKVITDKTTLLEGPAFDMLGNLYLTDIYHGEVLKVNKEKQLSIVLRSKDFSPSSILISKNNKLIIAAVSFDGTKGKIFSMNPDGSDIRTIVSSDKGFKPNDMVFDEWGGIYFTDASGNSGNLTGGVYYISSDFKSISPVLKNISGGNGIALSPDGKTLWVIEFSAGVLHRLIMQDKTHIRAFGENIAYRFNGLAADSMKADSDGNLYIAMHGQGRVVVLNKNAVPIGQIILDGQDKGYYLRSTNLAFRPGTREVYIVSSNDEELNTGGGVFKSYAFAPSLKPYWVK